MRHSKVLSSFLVFSLLVASISAFAQSSSSATIVGRVVDPQGAVVANAKVTATNDATGISRTTNTTSSGDYALPNLAPGTYTVKVEAASFAVSEAKSLKLNVGDQSDLNFKLAVAGAAQTVEVTTGAPLIETTKTDVSMVVSDLDMQRLPLTAGAGGVANDYAQLALTAPGVKLDTSGLTTDLIGPGSINNRGNLFQVDGANITDQLVSGRDGLGASVEEVQEFQVLTNNYNAEYGQAGGLIVNVVTKSGTNKFHGDGHMYFRGRNFGASNPFYNLGLIQNQDSRCPNIASNDVSGCPRAPFHRKEGGFTVGGPFIKDKLFWFASFELSRSATPLTLTPPGGAITLSQPVNNLLYSGKLDYHVSTNNNLTIRYNVDRAIADNQVVQTGTSITPDSLVSTQNHNAGLNVGFVSSITPNLVNEARFVFTRFITSTPDKTSTPGQQHPNFYTGADFCCPQGGLQKRYQFIDNVTWTHAKHTFKTGFNISYYPWNSLFPQFHFGQYGNFTSPTTPTTFTVAFGPGEVTSKDNIYGFYFQDTWKLTRKLTVNAGLRYDFEAGAFKGGKIHGPNGTCFQGNGLISACSSDKNNWQPRLGFTYAPFNNWLVKAGFAEVTQLAFNNVVLDSLNFDGTTLNTVVIDNTTPAGLAVLAAFPNAPSPALLAPFAPTLSSFGRVRPISPNLRNPEIRMANLGIEHEIGNNLVAEVQYIGQFGFGLFGERDVNFPTILADPAHPGFSYFGPRPNPAFTAVRTNENSRTSHYNGLLVSVRKRMSHHFGFAASYTWSHAMTSGEDFFGLSEPGDPRNIRAEFGPAFNDVRHAANFGITFDSAKWTDRSVVRWFTNDIVLGWVGQLQSGRPYPVSTATTAFANARFFGAGNETQQRPNVLPNGVISVYGVPSADGVNANFGPGAVANCIGAGFPAAQCAALQNTFIAPAGASPLGPLDSLTGDVVDFQQINGNLGRDAGRSLPFYKLDIRLIKAFRIPRTESVKLELEADAFNVLNHSNFQGNNTNDALSFLGLSASAAGVPHPDFFTCTGCLRPNGQYVGLNGQTLTVQDMLRGRTSTDLLHPNFIPASLAGSLFLGGIGDPASADIPRTFQLSFRVRF
ncbi:MAG TPA: TonB-dependent receptor [Verrucomicrobiae bacterium]|jgi:outer membrane receptor protein involved in Fe transport|nr:TonB-dependent receptor [Verrucomicrobiae bacterium]